MTISKPTATRRKRGASTDLKARFATLNAMWRENTVDSSRVQSKVADRNYLAIAALGRDALPLILEELRDNGGYWFPLLEALTGEAPESAEESESREGMRQAWLRWGRQSGLVS